MKNKKKIAKIIGGIVGIGAICCIIPACVISCGSSSSTSSNNTTVPTSNGLNDNLINATVTSNDASVSSSSFYQMMESLEGNQSASIDNSSTVNDMYSIWQSSTGLSSSYTFSLNQNITGSYKWYSLTSANATGMNAQPIGNNSWTQAVANLINNQGTYLASGTTYQYNGTISNGGDMFVCQIQNSTGTYYSKIIWLWTNSPSTATSSSNSSSSSQNNSDPLNLENTKCLIKLDNKNLKPCADNNSVYSVSDNTKLNFTLSIPGFNYQSFTNYSGYEVEWIPNNSSNENLSPSYLPLSDESSWNYTFAATDGGNSVSVNIIYNNSVILSSSGTVTNDTFAVPYLQIQWSKTKVGFSQPDTIDETQGYTAFTNPNYQWQTSTDNGKTWVDLKDAKGSLNGIGQLVEDTVPSLTIPNIDNSTTQYRLEIINSTNPSQILYSNVITPNDSLMTANISFSNPSYQSEFISKTWQSAIISTNQNQIYLSVSLNQLDKNITKTLNLKNVSGTIAISYLSNIINSNYYYGEVVNDPFYINVNDLSHYLQSNGTLLIPISMSTIVQNLNTINQAINQTGDYNTTLTNYQPCQISFSINQGKLNINSTNTLTATFETTNISLTSNATQVNNVYYVKWDQQISLTSANSMLNFPASSQIQYQWEVSTNNKDWQNLENGTGQTYSGSNNYNQLYYRLKITSLQGSDVVLYSNVIEIASAIPSATLTIANNGSATVDSFSKIALSLEVSQYNTSIANSNNIQVLYQYYDNSTNSWQDLSKTATYSSSYFYPFVPKYSGTNKVRVEYIFMGKIIQYTQPLTITELTPSISPANNLNSTGNSNNYISNNESTYTYTTGSVVQLDLDNNGVLNPSTMVNGYNAYFDISSISWYEKGNNTPLVTYNSNYFDAFNGQGSYTPGAYYGYSFRVSAGVEEYRAEISYNGSTLTTNWITIDGINSGTVATIQLANISALQQDAVQEGNSEPPTSYFNQYYFLNMAGYLGNQLPNLKFNLNIYQDGKSLDLNNLTDNMNNWETTWYMQTYNNSTWSTESIIQNTYPLSSKNAWNISQSIALQENQNNSNVYIPVRIRCLITEGTTQIYTNWYYIGGQPSESISWSY